MPGLSGKPPKRPETQTSTACGHRDGTLARCALLPCLLSVHFRHKMLSGEWRLTHVFFLRLFQRRKGFTVVAEKQESEWDADGVSLNFVPAELGLFYLHALRK